MLTLIACLETVFEFCSIEYLVTSMDEIYSLTSFPEQCTMREKVFINSVIKVLVHLGLSFWHRDPHADAWVRVRVPLRQREGPCVSVRVPGSLTLTQGPSQWHNGTLTLTQASAWGSLCQSEGPRWTRTLKLAKKMFLCFYMFQSILSIFKKLIQNKTKIN